MSLPPYLLLPLASGLVFAVGTMASKRAMEQGVCPWRSMFVANIIAALLYVPLWFAGKEPFSWTGTIHASVCGVTFFLGNMFAYLALKRGDVSVVTPILGMKVLIVALFTVLILGEKVPLILWLAAILVVVAIALLRGGNEAHRRRLAASIVLGILSAASNATTDVLLQKWVHAWGFYRFVPVMFITIALLSLAIIPLFREPLRAIHATTWRWLLPGAILIAVQSLAITTAIGIYGHATAVNIVYNSRGIWSVLLVWLIGHWFHNAERSQGHGVMSRRLAGSALLLAAIVIVFRA